MLSSHTNGGLAVLAGIQQAELCRLGATLSLVNCAIRDPDNVLHGQLVGQQDAHLGRLRSRCSFVPASWRRSGSLSKLDIRVNQWTKHKWNADYLESTLRVRAFIPRVSSRLLGMSLPRKSWLGKAQSPENWWRTFSLAHLQMGSRPITELRMWRH